MCKDELSFQKLNKSKFCSNFEAIQGNTLKTMQYSRGKTYMKEFPKQTNNDETFPIPPGSVQITSSKCSLSQKIFNPKGSASSNQYL